MAQSHKAAVRLKKGGKPIDNGLRFNSAKEASEAAQSFADMFGDDDSDIDEVIACDDDVNALFPPAAKTSKAR